jgi:protein SCO1/2
MLRLGDLAGKRRVITLFFGHCEASCPMALGRLKTLESKLPPGWTRWGGIVLVTLDPTRDSTGSLADFRRRMSLGKEGWTLLRGNGEDTRELAMLLGVAYRPSEANGGIEHNSVLALVDASGVVVRKYEGADPGPEFLEAMRTFLASPP